MKIRFLPKLHAPARSYSLTGEVLTCTFDDGESHTIDFSVLRHGDQFQHPEGTLGLIVRHAERDENDVLWLTLIEPVPAGVDRHWWYSEWFDGLPATDGPHCRVAVGKKPTDELGYGPASEVLSNG